VQFLAGSVSDLPSHGYTVFEVALLVGFKSSIYHLVSHKVQSPVWS